MSLYWFLSCFVYECVLCIYVAEASAHTHLSLCTYRLETLLKLGRGGKAFYKYKNKDRIKHKKDAKDRYKTKNKITLAGITKSQYREREMWEAEKNNYVTKGQQLERYHRGQLQRLEDQQEAEQVEQWSVPRAVDSDGVSFHREQLQLLRLLRDGDEEAEHAEQAELDLDEEERMGNASQVDEHEM